MSFVAIDLKILIIIDNYTSYNMWVFLEPDMQSMSQANCISPSP